LAELYQQQEHPRQMEAQQNLANLIALHYQQEQQKQINQQNQLEHVQQALNNNRP
jgi:hypothetical protein